MSYNNTEMTVQVFEKPIRPENRGNLDHRSVFQVSILNRIDSNENIAKLVDAAIGIPGSELPKPQCGLPEASYSDVVRETVATVFDSVPSDGFIREYGSVFAPSFNWGKTINLDWQVIASVDKLRNSIDRTHTKLQRNLSETWDLLLGTLWADARGFPTSDLSYRAPTVWDSFDLGAHHNQGIMIWWNLYEAAHLFAYHEIREAVAVFASSVKRTLSRLSCLLARVLSYLMDGARSTRNPNGYGKSRSILVLGGLGCNSPGISLI